LLLAAPLASRCGFAGGLFQHSALSLDCDAFGGGFFSAASWMNAQIAPYAPS
jgi:hypothetical protein